MSTATKSTPDSISELMRGDVACVEIVITGLRDFERGLVKKPEAPTPPMNLLTITIDATTFDTVLGLTPELFSKREAPAELALATAWNSTSRDDRRALIEALSKQTIGVLEKSRAT